MDAILDFFEMNQLSPFESIEGNLNGLESRIKKRISAAIAIIKDIEKNQTKPTNAMLQSLFEEKLEHEEPILIEKIFADGDQDEEKVIDTTVPKIRYERLEHQMNGLKTDFNHVLESVKLVKGGFGKGYLKLELTEEELIKFKRTLNNL